MNGSGVRRLVVERVALRRQGLVKEPHHYHDGDIVLRPMFGGICGTDRAIVDGRRSARADLLGHECIASVVGAPAWSGRSVGDVVVVNPNSPLGDDFQIGEHVDGCFATTVTFGQSQIDPQQFMLVPDALCRPLGVLAEPVACVMNAHRAIRELAAATDSWTIVGGGPYAAVHAVAALHGGASRVELWTRSPRCPVFTSDGRVSVRHISTWSDLATATSTVESDVAVIALAGGGMTALTALLDSRLVRPNGAVHLFGGFSPTDKLLQPNGTLLSVGGLRRRGVVRSSSTRTRRGACTLIGTRGATAIDFADALALLTREPLADALIADTIPFDALAAALAGAGVSSLATWGKTVVEFPS